MFEGGQFLQSWYGAGWDRRVRIRHLDVHCVDGNWGGPVLAARSEISEKMPHSPPSVTPQMVSISLPAPHTKLRKWGVMRLVPAITLSISHAKILAMSERSPGSCWDGDVGPGYCLSLSE